MSRKKELTVKLEALDDLFSTQEQREDESKENATISQYESKEYVLEIFLESKLATYFRSTWGLAEETDGILYTEWLPDTGRWQVWWLS